MKKLIFIITILLISLSVFSQNYYTNKFWNRLEADTIVNNQWFLYKGDTIFFPTYTNGRGYQIKNTDDPTDSMDVVNLRYFQDNAVTQPLDSLYLNPNTSTIANVPYTIFADTANRAVSVNLGNGVVLQIGQESLIEVYNNSGATIGDGQVVNGSGVNGSAITIEKSTNTGRYTALLITTEEIANNEYGFCVELAGKVRGLNTSGISTGEIYLNSVSGGLTNSQGIFPAYNYPLGACLVSDATNGVIQFRSDGINFNNTIRNAFNGQFRESVDADISSNGTTITQEIERAGGGDLTMMFSTGYFDLDCTPAIDVALTAGTDAAPQTNYLYVPISTKVPTVSTSGWPTEEHIRISDSFLRTASTTQTDGALVNRYWNNHLQGSDGMGHINHISERLRKNNAAWDDGVSAVMTVGASTTLDISTTEGHVYQLHRQTFPAQNTATGSDLHIVNNLATPYMTTANLESQTLDALGNSLAATSFSYVLWGVQNSDTEASHLMINLPTGSYSRITPDDAVADANGYSVYNIPKEFEGKGFLIARFTMILFSGAWTLYATEDLRGQVPNSSAGGGGTGGGGVGVTTFLGLTDSPTSYSSQSGKVVSVAASETALEFTDRLWTDDALNGIYFNNSGENVAIGLGTAVSSYKLSVDGGSDDGVYIDVTGETSADKITRMYSGTSTKFDFYGNGASRWYLYGDGTFTGTPTKVAQFDASGNILDVVLDTTSTLIDRTKWTEFINNNSAGGGGTTYSAASNGGLALSGTEFSMDIDNLLIQSTEDRTLDYLPFYDFDAGLTRRISFSNIDLVSFNSTGASLNDIPVSDGSGGITWQAQSGGGNITDGTVVGQMNYWSGSVWDPIITSKLFWDNTNGYIGLGTNTPNSPIEINTSDNTYAIDIDNDVILGSGIRINAGSGSTSNLRLYNYLGSTELFRVLGDGKVYMPSLGSDATTGYQLYINDATGLITKGASSGSPWTSGTGYLYPTTTADEVFIGQDNTGDVGSYKLQVFGNGVVQSLWEIRGITPTLTFTETDDDDWTISSAVGDLDFIGSASGTVMTLDNGLGTVITKTQTLTVNDETASLTIDCDLGDIGTTAPTGSGAIAIVLDNISEGQQGTAYVTLGAGATSISVSALNDAGTGLTEVYFNATPTTIASKTVLITYTAYSSTNVSIIWGVSQ